MAENNDEDENLPKPVIKNGRFGVPWSEWRTPDWFKVAKWMITSPNHSNVPSEEKLNEELPILKPNFDQPVNETIKVTWLGHATVVVQMENTTFITDPVFSDRASPTQALGSKRFRKVPCAVEQLPNIDFVLISHNHYDHLDYNSVRKLNMRFGNQITWFVPMGLKKWMTDTGCENVYELNWWENHKWDNRVEIIATPAQHWSKRTLTDDNKTLWASWCVLANTSKFFFAGDTGYPKEQDIFKIIGKKYGPFDLAAIPIGAYDPRWFMHDQHVDPAEAVKIHLDVQARFSVGVHWGTFALANEHFLAPRKELLEALKVENLDEKRFFTLNHGESREIAKTD